MPYVETKEIEADSKMFDAGFFFGDIESHLCQPSFNDLYASKCIFFGFTEHAEVVGVAHDYTIPDGLSSVVVFDS